MSKINIPPIKDGFNLSKINDAFATVVDHLNNKVFYRNVPEGEPNMLSNDLDMNGNRVYNLPEPIADHEPVRKKDIPNAQNLYKSLRVEDTQIPAFPNAIDRRNRLVSFDDQGMPVANLAIDVPLINSSALVSFTTRPVAEMVIASLSEGQEVLVQSDSSYYNLRTLNVVSSGVLVFKEYAHEFLTAEMFGAKGNDPLYDDGPAINTLINVMIATKLPGRLMAKSYYMLTKVQHTAVSSGFTLTGAGYLSTFLIRGAYASSGVSIYNKTGLYIQGITVDNRWGSGNDGAGVAWDFAHLQDADLGYLRAINCATYGGWVISGTDQITNNNVNLHDCVAFNTGGSGWQIQGARKSGHTRNKAINCGGDSSETGTGINFKVPVEDCWHNDCYAENVAGMGFSVGSSFPGVYAKRLSFKGFRSKNIGIGMRFGETEDSTVEDAIFDLKGINTDLNIGSVGHGVWLVNGARRNKISARVNNVANSRGVVSFADATTTGNTVIIDGIQTPVSGATLASFGTSVNNEVLVRKGFTAPSVARSDSGTDNVLEYEGIPYAQGQTQIVGDNLTLHHTKVATVQIDTEANAAADDLVTISPGVPGQRISLTLTLGTRVVTVKHGNVTTNGIRLAGGTDFVFDNTRKMLTLEWNSRSSQWIEQGRMAT